MKPMSLQLPLVSWSRTRAPIVVVCPLQLASSKRVPSRIALPLGSIRMPLPGLCVSVIIGAKKK